MGPGMYRGEAVLTWHTDDDGFDRAVRFEPGYNDTVPNRYGIHGMGIRFLLRGPKGVTQFLFNTGWVPGRQGIPLSLADHYPSGYDLGYHALRPQYEGAQKWGQCEFLPGSAECYYDGSSLAADGLLADFIREGEAVVWAALRARYDHLDKDDR